VQVEALRRGAPPSKESYRLWKGRVPRGSVELPLTGVHFFPMRTNTCVFMCLNSVRARRSGPKKNKELKKRLGSNRALWSYRYCVIRSATEAALLKLYQRVIFSLNLYTENSGYYFPQSTLIKISGLAMASSSVYS
jgi:hypothetical protein